MQPPQPKKDHKLRGWCDFILMSFLVSLMATAVGHSGGPLCQKPLVEVFQKRGFGGTQVHKHASTQAKRHRNRRAQKLKGTDRKERETETEKEGKREDRERERQPKKHLHMPKRGLWGTKVNKHASTQAKR